MSIDPPPGHGTRVLLCIPRLSGGGAERQLRLLAPRLVERGLRVSLFSHFAGEDAASLAAAGVACFPIVAASYYDPRLIWQLATAARRGDAQVIHTWLTQMDVIGGVVAIATRRKWVLSERSSRGAYGGGLKDKARASLGRFAEVVVANSPAGLGVWPDHPHRLIIENGVDFDSIREVPATMPSGMQSEGPLIVTVARLVPEKRVEAVIRAVARLRLSFPNVQLAIVGEGPEREALEALAVAAGIGGNTSFTGFRPNAWSLIKAGSVFVSASRVEGQPNVVLEAAAVGTPQVLSDIPMHRDAVGNGGALFVDPTDSDALAAAIATLINAPDAARAVASTARAAVAHLSIDRAADFYADLYRRAANGLPLPCEGDDLFRLRAPA